MPILTGSTVGPLLQAADLADFAGAPFTDSVVLAAGESIRSEACWHIAPSVSETLTVDSTGGQYLILDTLRLTDVTAVRDVTDPANPVTLDGWSAAPTSRFTSGILRRTTCDWPCGVLEIDVVHGYDSCPQDLLAAAAALSRAAGRDVTVGSQTAGPFGQTLSVQGLTAEGDQTRAVIARYTLPPRP